MWGGRFSGGGEAPGSRLRALGDSLPFDWRLLGQDVEGSRAWARGLAGAGVLSAAEAERLCAALSEAERAGAAMEGAPVGSGAEDVHSWVEAAVIGRVGDLGKRLHTGRSRNDQAATDLRLWVREELLGLIGLVRGAQAALAAFAEREAGTPMPGYTHLQRAQPVTLGHWALAYVEMLERDARRLAAARDGAGECPLGSGALAGTAYAVDRAAVAAALGFDGPTRNSLDAVGSRDFVLEALAALAICAVHLSRFAEDLVLYTSAEFGFVELPDSVSSGSSLMPQKKNPDGLELMRGKAGRVLGALVGLLATVKGLPLSYNKDLQEDKEGLFDAMDTLAMSLEMVAPTVGGMRVDRARCEAAARGGHANATELADYLVSRGVAFRDAHEAAGRAVRRAIEAGGGIEELPLAALQEVSPQIEADVFDRLTLASTLGKRDVFGGTAPARVRKAAARAGAMVRAGAQPVGVALRRARVGDAGAIAALLTGYAASGRTIARTAADVASHIRDFTVAVRGGVVVGCGALVLSGEGLAEVRSVAVAPAETGRGVGSAVVGRLCRDGASVGAARVFVLTCTSPFFARLGFEPAALVALGEAGARAWARRDRAGADWAFMVWETLDA